MYFFTLVLNVIIYVDCFVIDYRPGQFTLTHINRVTPNDLKYGKRSILVYAEDEGNKEDGQELQEPDQESTNPVESHKSTNEDDELIEFVRSSEDGEEQPESSLKISRRLWKLLTGLIAYRTKYGDYLIEDNFAFGKEEGGYLSGYKLGRNLGNLLKLLDLQTKDEKRFKDFRTYLKRKKTNFLDSDLQEAPKLLWMLNFPTKSYAEENKLHKRLRKKENVISRKLANWPILKEVKSLKVGDNEDEPDYVEEPPYAKKAKKIILDEMFDRKERMRQSLIFKNPQQFPEPSNRAQPRPDLIRRIVNDILDKNRATCPLIKRDTRQETEGGYHYAFFHWSFEQVLQALVMFNDMYFDYNKELLINCEKSGEAFKPLTFNSLKRSFRVPETGDWPTEFHGMPLGLFVSRFRNGDIDAKEHWLRRPVLDQIGFNWGNGLRYLAFTWDKLELGLIWYINFRGFPIYHLPPDLVIPKTTTVAKFGKPEEIQGLKLGRLLYTAFDQMQVIRRYYPDRYKFFQDLQLDFFDFSQLHLGYRPLPHSRFNRIGSDLLVSRDHRFLFDSTNPPPDELRDHVTPAIDLPDED